MKRVTADELLSIAAYEAIRDQFRARIIAEKRARRVKLGPMATAVFENHDTALFQIQEMLRTERITKPSSIQHELETYNQLVPEDNELSATVMIAIDDKPERENFLIAARGFEQAVAVVIDGERFAATWEKERELDDRASAVMYLKFPLSKAACAAIRASAKGRAPANVELVVDHDAYTARTALPPETVRCLAEDFE